MTKSKKQIISIALLILLMFTQTGCYWWQTVGASQVGLQLDRGQVKNVAHPGKSYSGGIYEEFELVNISNIDIEWVSADDELITGDKQPIGIIVSVTVRRNPNGIAEMYRLYNPEATDDAQLTDLVLDRLPGVVKSLTARPGVTLNGLLGVVEVAEGENAYNRDLFRDDIKESFQEAVADANLIVTDVRVKNITASQEFLDLLESKALITQQTEYEQARIPALTAQVIAEEKQTEVAVVIAERDSEVAAATAEVYENNPATLEIRKLELQLEMMQTWAEAVSNADTLFVGSDGVSIMTGEFFTSAVAEQGE